jgi:hypothetical protein
MSADVSKERSHSSAIDFLAKTALTQLTILPHNYRQGWRLNPTAFIRYYGGGVDWLAASERQINSIR